MASWSWVNAENRIVNPGCTVVKRKINAITILFDRFPGGFRFY
jgi:hypothetical protein